MICAPNRIVVFSLKSPSRKNLGEMSRKFLVFWRMDRSCDISHTRQMSIRLFTMGRTRKSKEFDPHLDVRRWRFDQCDRSFGGTIDCDLSILHCLHPLKIKMAIHEPNRMKKVTIFCAPDFFSSFNTIFFRWVALSVRYDSSVRP